VFSLWDFAPIKRLAGKIICKMSSETLNSTQLCSYFPNSPSFPAPSTLFSYWFSLIAQELFQSQLLTFVP